MNDFGEMLREALVDDEPYRPEAGEAALEEALARFRSRMRTVRFMGLLMTLGPSLFLVVGGWFFLKAADDTERIFGALLVLFGLGAVGLGKMWFHAMVSHVQVMRELKSTQLLVAGLSEELRAMTSTRER